MRTLCVLAVLAALLITPLRLLAANYTNPDYGFNAELDQQLKICTTPSPGSNHGFVLLLRSNSCETSLDQPRIEVFVQYNVLLEAKTTKALSEDACGEQQAIRTRIVSAGVHVYKCQPKVIGTLAQWRYFFLRPTSAEWAGNWVVFYIDLYTVEKSAKQDLNALQKLLHGIRWIGFTQPSKANSVK